MELTEAWLIQLKLTKIYFMKNDLKFGYTPGFHCIQGSVETGSTAYYDIYDNIFFYLCAYDIH